MRRILLLLTIALAVTFVLTGCRKQEDLPVANTATEPQDMNILQLSAEPEDNVSIGEPDPVVINEDTLSLDDEIIESADSYETLSDFFAANQEFGKQLQLATGAILTVYDNTMEFMFDITWLQAVARDMGYNLSTNDYAHVIQIKSCDYWDGMVHVQRYLSTLLGQDIVVKNSYYIYDKEVFAREYTSETPALPDVELIYSTYEDIITELYEQQSEQAEIGEE